ncbi:VOC family protein [Brucella melitensis]|uniref:VOC family protein n=1 Tax=Brucella melitensis TaxID=29459 RepID=UPI0001B5969C|nr:VOC family protein [Brucella melitensis]AIJ86601.1 glyoxalase/Bleomycin resistance /Dioxygenase superfamily protein [Brucella melitensis bv. 3 str. Ether]AOG51624.1 glyoxalase [Brucella melitensis]ARY26534.1 glyoxalase [Brucella melitensis]ARY29711.1 glyoxalase [Brucella melitensis]ARY39173.1 glyoxalase [Brucella melitensis]
MSLFDHIGFKARDINRSLSFYESCMPELGLDVIARSGSGFFVSGGERAPVPFLWIYGGDSAGEHGEDRPGDRLHLMFTAGSREEVEAFYKAAIRAGGKDSGSPSYQGPEEMGYYAALVFDPDGNTLEAGFRERKR